MKYIKWIMRVVKFVLYIVVLLWGSFKFAIIVGKNKDKTIMKYKLYNRLMLDWITNLEKGKSVYGYLKRKRFMNIAIYGRRGLGEYLREQLSETDVSLRYFIDRAACQGNIDQIPIYRLDDELPKVDVIIVTPIWDYENIRKQLSEKVSYPIVSLQDIIAGEEDE